MNLCCVDPPSLPHKAQMNRVVANPQEGTYSNAQRSAWIMPKAVQEEWVT